ncbi:ras association domain-containing protein 9-like [Acanthaster planci]|uniref:Ras association domain-containing protein 9-like n=1 Tax=Acanthaster planci TaxID=133434 RepID=A0A8B7Y9F8_ACAPL|nr:ras association domain-containing protein 9-like [Acanthaster planci]XP_022088351.1 ras association domain-containing protein 9-like [Acanthaster planci]XP_022088352.1 ras association domain-containing protein 9-like [Acanthaster planci]XP_022088353.1 ras association domain-containing protein 9-like [Acanthaster planci]XP_022088354.1 ras association domain-containing protein 9-like [Acanthaster planci]XP_022088356.1 ras association domain-containing protein 9-like [Acanthaster planci]XP_02
MSKMAEITVWVNGREKRITGVGRSTTCRDVVTLLLRNHLKTEEVLPSYSHCFSLFERWRGCERVLSPRTRLYKLWKAWGDEQKNVRFTLKRSTSGEPHPEEIGDELIGQGIRKSATGHPSGKMPIHVDNDKKVRKSTVRPLRVKDKTNSHRKGSESCSTRHKDKSRNSESSERNQSVPVQDLESLVQTVVKQSKRLQELFEMIQEIDMEIEFYETKAHLLRVEEKGKNYVQDAYLSRLVGDNSQSDDTDDTLCELVTNGCSDLEAYISLYEKLLDVESQLTTKRGTISKLTETIERARLLHMENPTAIENDKTQILAMTKDKLTNPEEAPLKTDDEKYLADHQREVGLVRAQLEWYTDVCIAQKSEITTMQNRLASAESLYNDKCHWLDILVTELTRLERNSLLDSPDAVDTEIGAEPNSQTHSASTEECDTNDRGELKPDDGHDSGICLSPDETPKLQTRTGIDNDSSSDTGLSSLHSQEDVEHLPVVAETLV